MARGSGASWTAVRFVSPRHSWDGGAEGFVPSGARLICDIGIGGTNPDALEALSKKLGDNLRCLPGPHAKVYLSDRGCVVGSANLSNNGIGFLHRAVLSEASVSLATGDPAAMQAAEWFEGLWNASRVVGTEEIAQARDAWKRAGGIPTGRGGYRDLRAALEDPGSSAQNWRYFLTRDEVSDNFLQWANRSIEQRLSRLSGVRAAVIDYFYDSAEAGGIVEKAGPHFINIHRGKRGVVRASALRLLATAPVPSARREAPDDEGVVSFF